MDDFSQAFEDRLQEIEAYLTLLAGLEQQVQEGIPQFGESGATITVQQQRILYSSVYLQLLPSRYKTTYGKPGESLATP